MSIVQRLRRPCKICSKKFTPNGTHCRTCPKCKKQSSDRRTKYLSTKKKLSYVFMKSTK